ncbi:hypothetical protein ABBQ38_002561 [Trebouxia sp. C0009 RCD-2024]
MSIIPGSGLQELFPAMESSLGIMLQTKILVSGAIPGAFQVDTLEVDGAVVNLRPRTCKLAVAPGDVDWITL